MSKIKDRCLYSSQSYTRTVRKKHHSSTALFCRGCLCPMEKEECFVLHKTRRQTHAMCMDCASIYVVDKLDKILKMLLHDRNISIDIPCSPLPEKSEDDKNISYERVLKRNQCQYKIRITQRFYCIPKVEELYVKIITLQDPKSQLCVNGSCCGIFINHLDSNRNEAICPYCKTSFCVKCKISPHHFGMTCQEAKRFEELAEGETDDGRIMLAMKKSGAIKNCPGCNHPTMKPVHESGGSGCNHMHCNWERGCLTHWCWLCRQILNGDDPYSHYNSGNCSGALWTGVETNT